MVYRSPLYLGWALGCLRFGLPLTWTLTISGSTGTTQMPSPSLLGELASMNPRARREVATVLGQVSETFSQVPDGKTTSHVVGVLAHLLDPS